MPTNVANYELYNAVIETLSDDFQTRFPASSQADMNHLSNILFSNEFQAEQNAFLDALINKIALTRLNTRLFSNPLAQFKRGTFYYGNVVEEIEVDIREQMNPTADYDGEPDPFTRSNPKVDAMYHKENIKRSYKTTVSQWQMQSAFRNEGGLQSVVDEIVNELYKSATIDEFLIMKQIFNEYITAPKVAHLDGQVRAMNKPVDQATGLELLADINYIKGLFRLPSRNFNPMKHYNQNTYEQMQLFMLAEASSALTVMTFAQTYNPEYLGDSKTRHILDNFGTPEPSFTDTEVTGTPYLVLAERDWFNVYDKEPNRFTSLFNPEGLYWNYWLHRRGLYTASYFKNFVAWVEPDLVP